MKVKLVAVLLVAILPTLLTGCGNREATRPDPQAIQVAQDKATMEALATAMNKEQRAEEPPQATAAASPVPAAVTVVVTAMPQDTHTPPPATATPLPPTATPLPPSATPEANTPPGSILEVGQSWHQDGVRLWLEEARFHPESECLTAVFNLYNDTSHTLIVTIQGQAFFAEDNVGRQWRFYKLSRNQYGCGSWAEPDSELTDAIEPGEHFDTRGYGSLKVSFAGFVTDTNVSEVILTVNEVSQIRNAKWQIPIYH